jgi:hypothetical protein
MRVVLACSPLAAADAATGRWLNLHVVPLHAAARKLVF